MAQDLARDQGQAGRDWLTFVTEVDELSQKRSTEQKRAWRKAKKRLIERQSALDVGQIEVAVGQMSSAGVEQDYTELLIDFLGKQGAEK